MRQNAGFDQGFVQFVIEAAEFVSDVLLEQLEHRFSLGQLEFLEQGVIKGLADFHRGQRVFCKYFCGSKRQVVQPGLQVGNLFAEPARGLGPDVLHEHDVFHVVLADQAELVVEFFCLLRGFFGLGDRVRAQQAQYVGHEVRGDFRLLLPELVSEPVEYVFLMAVGRRLCHFEQLLVRLGKHLREHVAKTCIGRGFQTRNQFAQILFRAQWILIAHRRYDVFRFPFRQCCIMPVIFIIIVRV